MNKAVMIAVGIVTVMVLSCNNGLSSHGGGSEHARKTDRSQRTVIDRAEYVDFTVKKHNARAVKREDMLYTLGGSTYKNGNSTIVISMKEGTIELSSDEGFFEGKSHCQVYGVFGFEIQAASEDCLYLRRNSRKNGYILVDGNVYRNDAMPDLGVCLPLYGYSRNRIEVSSIMDGYIIMPSGTYWKK